jgi:hypothetical protein
MATSQSKAPTAPGTRSLRRADYAFAQPSLTTKKLRRLELAAGAPRWQGARHVRATNNAMRHTERALALQAQRAYERTVKDRQQQKGASATPGRASLGSSSEQVARQTTGPKVCALTRRRPRPHRVSHRRRPLSNST